MAYTGVSVTIPANCFFSFSFLAVYAYTQPLAVLLSEKATDGTSPQEIVARNDNGAAVSFSGITGNSSKTYYFWAKYNSVATNEVRLRGWYGEF